MLRRFAFLLTVFATSAQADTIIANSQVDAVTIYQGVAEVTRQIDLALPAGQHRVVVPDLPQSLSLEGLRLSAPADTPISAITLNTDRLPVTPEATTQAIDAARAELDRLEGALRDQDAAIAFLDLRTLAADEQLQALRDIARQTPQAGADPAAIRDLARMVGDEALVVLQSRFEAEQEVAVAQRDRDALEDQYQDAEQALAALVEPRKDAVALQFDIASPDAREAVIEITTQEGFASWAPVYDLRLATGTAPSVEVTRSVVVEQTTGQDWIDVDLTLSTARPNAQSQPSQLWPQLRRIIPEDAIALTRNAGALSDTATSGLAAPALEAMPVATVTDVAVTYQYPDRVDIRTGVDALRLQLDRDQFDARLWAEAVPALDPTAYRLAAFANTTEQVFLPGQAQLFVDGSLVGFSTLDLSPPQAEIEMGFGAIDGLQLEYQVPQRSEGDIGVFTSSNERREETTLSVTNLTGQDWQVRLREAIPYSEQEDLRVTYEASPRPARVDVDAQRGMLEWDLDVAAGGDAEVTVETILVWPDGFVLQ